MEVLPIRDLIRQLQAVRYLPVMLTEKRQNRDFRYQYGRSENTHFSAPC